MGVAYLSSSQQLVRSTRLFGLRRSDPRFVLGESFPAACYHRAMQKFRGSFPFLVFFCSLLLTVGACSDDDAPPPDSGGVDLVTVADSGVPKDTGPAVDVALADVLGTACSASTPCAAGYVCAYPDGTDNGYCTVTCEAQGTLCEDRPAGTMFGCAFADGEDVLCVFFCATAEASYPCPNGLVCSSQEDPVGSGQRICVPPAQ